VKTFKDGALAYILLRLSLGIGVSATCRHSAMMASLHLQTDDVGYWLGSIPVSVSVSGNISLLLPRLSKMLSHNSSTVVCLIDKKIILSGNI